METELETIGASTVEDFTWKNLLVNPGQRTTDRCFGFGQKRFGDGTAGVARVVSRWMRSCPVRMS